MTVIDKLAGGKYRRNEFCFINQIVKSGFQQADKIFSGIAFSANSFNIVLVELLFRDISIINF